MQDLVSMVDILQGHAKNFSEHTAIRFITQKGWESLTYSELNRKVIAVAEQLQQRVDVDSRAVIILPTGLNYIVALLACFYAGIIAVPIYPPRKNQHANRVYTVIEDSEASLVITHQPLVDQFSNYSVLNMDGLPASRPGMFQPIKVKAQDVAFIQYTSGSTTEPKGVLISHANLMSNIKIIQSIFPGLSWRNIMFFIHSH
jgi:acyl-CoA synthetase (AMP-forming)/AMP-acid ligase II